MSRQERAEETVKRLKEKIDGLSIEDKVAYIKAQIIKGRVRNGDYWTNFDSIVSVLNDVYPDTWDIFTEVQLNQKYDDSDNISYSFVININIVILFKKFNITNGRGSGHTIHDMYIKLTHYPRSINSEYHMTFSGFNGMRMGHTMPEIISHYTHSHMSGGVGGANITFHGFCLGSGEINNTITMLGSKYTDNIFKLFLYQLQTYLEWESLAGRPYKKYRDISTKDKLGEISYNIKKTFYVKMIEHYKNIASTYGIHVVPNLDYVIINGVTRIKDNERFETYLRFKGVTENKYSDSYSNPEKIWLAVKDTEGNYFSLERSNYNSQINIDAMKNRVFSFRGEPVKYTVISDETAEVSKEIYIHPQIKNYVRARIEQKINKKRFQASGTSQQDTTGDTRGNHESDKVSM